MTEVVAEDPAYCSWVLQEAEARLRGDTIGALILTYTISGVPYRTIIVEWAPDPILIIKATISFRDSGQTQQSGGCVVRNNSCDRKLRLCFTP